MVTIKIMDTTHACSQFNTYMFLAGIERDEVEIKEECLKGLSNIEQHDHPSGRRECEAEGRPTEEENKEPARIAAQHQQEDPPDETEQTG